MSAKALGYALCGSETQRPYPTYKLASVDWAGGIPRHWDLKRLKFVAVVNMGQSPPSNECNTDEVGSPFLQGNAEFGPRCPSPRFYCPTAQKYALADDFLLSVRAPVGAINVADRKYGIGRGLCGIRVDSRLLDHTYAWYLLHLARHELHAVATGSTYDAVAAEEIKNMHFILPPKAEQCAIATFLDRETAKIDALIAKREELIALLEEKQISHINWAVTKGIDPNAPMKDSGIDCVGRIPSHWHVQRNKTVFRLFSGFAFESDYFFHSQQPAPVLVTPGNFHPSGGLYFTEDNTIYYTGAFGKQFCLQPGDQLIVMTDLSYKRLILGACVEVDREGLLLNQRVAKILTLPQARKAIDPRFLKYALNSTYLREQVLVTATGATVFHSSPQKIGNCWFAMPPRKEQEEVVEHLNKVVQKIEGLKALIHSHVGALVECRTALVSIAVTGKIDVRGEVQ